MVCSGVIAGYAVAAGSVVVAFAASLLLDICAVTAPVSLFVCAVMFSAWFGGFGPGLFSMSLAFLAFDYYYVTPIHTFSIDVKEVPRISVFTLATLFAGLLSAAQRRTTESLRRSRDDLEGWFNSSREATRRCTRRTPSEFAQRRLSKPRRSISHARRG